MHKQEQFKNKMKKISLWFEWLLDFVERFASGLGQEKIDENGAEGGDEAKHPEHHRLAEQRQHAGVALDDHENVNVDDGRQHAGGQTATPLGQQLTQHYPRHKEKSWENSVTLFYHVHILVVLQIICPHKFWNFTNIFTISLEQSLCLSIFFHKKCIYYLHLNLSKTYPNSGLKDFFCNITKIGRPMSCTTPIKNFLIFYWFLFFILTAAPDKLMVHVMQLARHPGVAG